MGGGDAAPSSLLLAAAWLDTNVRPCGVDGPTQNSCQYHFPVGHILCALSTTNNCAHRAGCRERHICTPVLILWCTFLEPSGIRTFPVPLPSRCTGDGTIVKIFASMKMRKRINWSIVKFSPRFCVKNVANQICW